MITRLLWDRDLVRWMKTFMLRSSGHVFYEQTFGANLNYVLNEWKHGLKFRYLIWDTPICYKTDRLKIYLEAFECYIAVSETRYCIDFRNRWVTCETAWNQESENRLHVAFEYVAWYWNYEELNDFSMTCRVNAIEGVSSEEEEA